MGSEAFYLIFVLKKMKIFFLFLLLPRCMQPLPKDSIKEISIPLADSTHLAADLFLPPNFQKDTRYPVLLEYLPYRKAEHRRNRYGLYSYFLNHGYIVARVDIRGTGQSEGKLIAYEVLLKEKTWEEVIKRDFQ